MAATNWDNLHGLLRGVYEEMMPLCADMAGLAKGIAGLGALFYVAYRVWKSLANAEQIDVFPLLRPLVLGVCIMFFPTLVIGTLNTVLSPVTAACSHLVDAQIGQAQTLQVQKDRMEHDAMMRDPTQAYMVDDEEFDRQLDELGVWDAAQKAGMYVKRGLYKLKEMIVQGFRWLLETIFQAASLIIDTIRTFFLVVLTILGPVAFGFAVYDGFHNTLTSWLARYIAVYMWLPVSDLLSAILTRIRILILRGDIAELSDPSFIPDGSGTVYIIFMLIGIAGYFCVPTVAGWIVQAGSSGAYGKAVNKGAGAVMGALGAISGHITGKLKGR